MSTPEQHLEEMEHAKHAAHDAFDRRVSLTITVVAAVLACVTLLSHRAHNDTLRFQAQASDEWNHYQAKKNRQYLYEALADLLTVSQGDSLKTNAAAVKRIEDWRGNVGRYEADNEKIKTKAEEFEKEGKHAHEQAFCFDLGELGVEFSLVVCSVSLLTKRKAFWYAGMLIGLSGAAVGVTGLFL